MILNFNLIYGVKYTFWHENERKFIFLYIIW